MGMSPNIKVKKGRALVGWPNAAPTISITVSQLTATAGTPTGPYTASALDADQGDLSATVVWSTVADGVLGLLLREL